MIPSKGRSALVAAFWRSMVYRVAGKARALLKGWLQDPGGPAMVAFAVYVLAFLWWMPVGWHLLTAKALVGDLVLIPAGAVAVFMLWRVSTRPTLGQRSRRAWRLIAMAFCAYWLGDLVWTFNELVRHVESPFPSWADAGYLLWYPLLLCGLLSFPAAPQTGSDRLKFWLDASTVLLAGWMAVWYLVLGPTAVDTETAWLTTVLSAAYPIGDLVVLFGITAVILQRPKEANRVALWMLGASLLLFVIADLAHGYMALLERYETGDWPDALWLGAYFLAALAGHHEYSRGQSRQDDMVQEAPQARLPLPSFLPYAAVAVGYGLLLGVARREAAYPLGGLLAGAVAVTATVIARQFVVMREHMRVLTDFHRLAATDGLTGLQNRRRFFEVAQHRLAVGRDRSRPLSAILLDLDDLKTINDRFGHSAGDELLVAVAERLNSCVRDPDTVARLGGDEFALLLHGVSSKEEAVRIAQRVMEALSEPFQVHGSDAHLSASVGVATSTVEGEDAEELLRKADFAMYTAKRGGKGRFEVFDPAMHAAMLDRLTIEVQLQEAVERREFILQYQPIVALDTLRVIGAEALIRWRHPERGLMLPADFIPLAEETGLIVPIGWWVLREALAQARSWQEEFAPGPPLQISVNLSARQFQHADLLSEVSAALTASGVGPRTVMLEITETALMRDTDATTEKLRRLRELGVRLAIDDFGTGYSSLSYLRQFPIDTLKIHKAFVDGLAAGPEESALVRAIIRLGETLGLEIVAEGIESFTQLAHLRAFGCQQAQGNLFAEPLGGREVATLVRSGTPAVPPATLHALRIAQPAASS